jgi:hypothetical protein
MSNDFGNIFYMGRIGYKLVADYLISISVYWLNHDGYFKTGKSNTFVWSWKYSDKGLKVTISSHVNYEDEFINRIELWYPHFSSEGELENIQEILITSARCNLGGKRYWFICECGKRVGVIFKGGDRFACRHCHNLTYQSRNENRRSGKYALYRSLLTLKKIDELCNLTKRTIYAGKPTRNYKRLLSFQYRYLSDKFGSRF